MSWLDLAFLVVLLIFVAQGWFVGFFHILTSLLATALGVFLGGQFYEAVSDRWGSLLNLGRPGSLLLSFVAIYLVTTKLFSILVWGATHSLNVHPGAWLTRAFNRGLGALLALAEGVIVLGLIVYLLQRLPFAQIYQQSLASSILAPILLSAVSWLIPLLPSVLRKVQEIVPLKF